MERAVIVCACESMYSGLHGMNDVKAIELDETDLEIAREHGIEMAEGVISSYGLEEEYDEEDFENGGEYYIYRQKDDSTLTIEEVEEMINHYGYNVTEHENFEENFKEWA